MRVQQLPKTAEQLTALEASALGVHKHEEGAAVWGQLLGLAGRSWLRVGSQDHPSGAGPGVSPTSLPMTSPNLSQAGPLSRKAHTGPGGHTCSPHHRPFRAAPMAEGAPTGCRPAWSSEHTSHTSPAGMCVPSPCRLPDPMAQKPRREVHGEPHHPLRATCHTPSEDLCPQGPVPTAVRRSPLHWADPRLPSRMILRTLPRRHWTGTGAPAVAWGPHDGTAG